MRVAIIYNEPKETEPAAHWLFSSYTAEAGSLEADATSLTEVRDTSEFGILESMQEVQTALQEDGHEVIIFNVDGKIWRLIDFLRDEKPDAIFNLCESVEAESTHEAYVAGIYELLHIPYTGAGPFTLMVALNKARAKEIFTYHGIPTAKHVLCASLNDIAKASVLQFPVIVKPAWEDASIGIDNRSVVDNIDDLQERVKFIIDRFQEPALVEEFIEGRELNVAVLGNNPPVVMPISEIDFSTMPEGLHKIVSYEAKWIEDSPAYISTKPRCPAPLDEKDAEHVREIALRAYKAMECRDYARVDIRLKDHTPYVLEVNPNPDLSADAGFMRSTGVYGLNYNRTICKILSFAGERRVQKP